MVSSDLWTNIDSRLGETCMVIPGLSVMTVADLLQLPPVRRNLIFLRFLDKDSINHLLGLQLYHLFEYAELTEVVIENDKLYVDLLKKV